MNLKCRFNLHSWDSCECIACGKTHHKWNGCKCLVCGNTQHEWIWEINSIDSCMEHQVCRYCKIEGAEQRERHEKLWKYKIEGDCEQVPTCRCGQVSDFGEKRYFHEWGNWVSISDSSHQRTCRRNSSHTEIEPHNWEIIDASYVNTIPQGGRCIDPHWGLCEDSYERVSAQRHHCHTCGADYTVEISREQT